MCLVFNPFTSVTLASNTFQPRQFASQSPIHLCPRHLSKTWASETFAFKTLVPKTFASTRFVAKIFQFIHTRTFVSHRKVTRSCNSPHTCISESESRVPSTHDVEASKETCEFRWMNHLRRNIARTLLCHCRVSNCFVGTNVISAPMAQIFHFCCRYTNLNSIFVQVGFYTYISLT
jgi:hypothetical protein